MRKNTRENARRDTAAAGIARVQRYHEGGTWSGEEYAYTGFKANKYFTSDRFIPLDTMFRRPDGKPLKGYGLEIETTCRGVNNQTVLAEVFDKIIFPQFPADLFKMQNDASLAGDTSAECITQVMTKEFIRNNYPAFRAMYDTYFPAFGISADQSCGMHCNISNAVFGAKEETQVPAIRKLYYIVNTHWTLCCALFNRDPRRTHYASRCYTTMQEARSLDLDRAPTGHGVCFNFAHWRAGRIELRLVGPQKNFPCFRNTMESLFHLVDAVKRLSWEDCDDVVKIFNGCNQYVFDRLKSYCKDAGAIHDYQLDAIRPTVQRAELI